ncbi:MAG: LysR substrate-binding domain-containing protein [Azospirillaceae bacterium]|nr:LysR substrate-binding domain-containing protein [Azospirillaceae bacterium]
MSRSTINDLPAFFAIAQERSFTKAAALLGVSQPKLSVTIRQLEERLGVRLLSRTTRSVSLTEAGERLLRSVEPLYRNIEAGLEALNLAKDAPAGTVRLAVGASYLRAILWPKLMEILPRYPDLKVEITVGLVDITKNGIDAGVKLSDDVPPGMTAVAVSPDFRFAVVGSKSYFTTNPVPQMPRDLAAHRCINVRPPPYDELWPWEFEKDSREEHIQVDGQLAFNQLDLVMEAAVAGFGLAYVPECLAAPYLAEGRVQRVLEDWCLPSQGYHMYFPESAQISPALGFLIDALRYRG